MNEQINKYIESKALAWSETTLKSEQSRLNKISHLLQLAAPELHKALQSLYAPYTVVTTMQRIASFKAWQGDNSYQEYIKNAARLFKGQYNRKRVGITFEEARARIDALSSPAVKQAAILMLTSGLRVHEALKYDGNGLVSGKGSKIRRVFSTITVKNHDITYLQVYRALKEVGLKPHDLRKLAATKLAASGFKEADLLEVMGWSNIQTAGYYLQPMLESEMDEKIKQALGA